MNRLSRIRVRKKRVNSITYLFMPVVRMGWHGPCNSMEERNEMLDIPSTPLGELP
jgi:hypothetical protein